MDVRLEKSYSYHICEIYSDNVTVCLYIKFSFYLCSFNRECMEHNVMKSFRIFLCYFQTEWSVFFTLQCDLFTSCNVSNNAYMDDPYLQKQLFVGVFQSRFSKKFHNIHRKTPLSKSLFHKVAGLKAYNFSKKRLLHRFFSLWILQKLFL